MHFWGSSFRCYANNFRKIFSNVGTCFVSCSESRIQYKCRSTSLNLLHLSLFIKKKASCVEKLLIDLIYVKLIDSVMNYNYTDDFKLAAKKIITAFSMFMTSDWMLHIKYWIVSKKNCTIFLTGKLERQNHFCLRQIRPLELLIN